MSLYDAASDWKEIRFYDAYGQMRAAAGLSYNYTQYRFADAVYYTTGVGFGGQWGYYTDYPSLAQQSAGGAAATAGQILLGLRYYDPQQGRFYTRDPIGYEGGINLYAYCGNNPIMGIDPMGLFDFTIGGFEFTNDVVSDGLSTGLAATAYEFSGGYVGGKYRNHQGFGGALKFAQGADVILTFVDGVGLVSKIGKGIQSARSIPKIWKAIKATQEFHPGTVIPKSFELALGYGRKIWVHPNATKHIAELVTQNLAKRQLSPAYAKVVSQALLESLHAATKAAVKGGIKYEQIIRVNEWELIFSAPRGEGLLPVLKHAVLK